MQKLPASVMPGSAASDGFSLFLSRLIPLEQWLYRIGGGLSGHEMGLQKMDERFHVWKGKRFPGGGALQRSDPHRLVVVTFLP